MNFFVTNNNYFFNTLSNKLDYERITEIINIRYKFEWLLYTITIIILLLKWLLIAISIYIILILFDIDNIDFSKYLKIVLFSEICVYLNIIYKIIYFYFYPPTQIYNLSNFKNLSIFNFINKNNVSSFLIYPLQQINLFELAYWIVLTIGIKKFIQKPFWYCFKITALSYGIGLLIWVIFVVFLQTQFS